MPPFTKQTPTPRTRGAAPLDQAIVQYTYTDMRGNVWTVMFGGESWRAYPSPASAEAYGLTHGRMFAAGSDASMLVDGIEERLESLRAEGNLRPKKRKAPWWLYVAAGYVAMKWKGW